MGEPLRPQLSPPPLAHRRLHEKHERLVHLLHALTPLEMPIQVEQLSRLLDELDCLTLLSLRLQNSMAEMTRRNPPGTASAVRRAPW